MWKRGTLEGGEKAAERCSASPGPFDFAQGRLRPGPTLDPDPHAHQTTTHTRPGPRKGLHAVGVTGTGYQRSLPVYESDAYNF